MGRLARGEGAPPGRGGGLSDAGSRAGAGGFTPPDPRGVFPQGETTGTPPRSAGEALPSWAAWHVEGAPPGWGGGGRGLRRARGPTGSGGPPSPRWSRGRRLWSPAAAAPRLAATTETRMTRNDPAIDFLASRRSTPPKLLAAPAPDRAALEDILRLAARSPDHGMLVPWRFIVLAEPALRRLGRDIAAAGEIEGLDSGADWPRGGRSTTPARWRWRWSPRRSRGNIPTIEQQLSAGAVCLSPAQRGAGAGLGGGLGHRLAGARPPLPAGAAGAGAGRDHRRAGAYRQRRHPRRPAAPRHRRDHRLARAVIFGDFLKALSQIGDPRFTRVIKLGLALTLALLVAFYGLWLWLTEAVTPGELTIPIVGEVHWLGDLLRWGSLFFMVFTSMFLMVPVASAITSMFLDDVADAVEGRYYPWLGPAPRMTLWQGVVETVNALGLILVANLVALFVYLAMPLTIPFLFIALNGFLLGREYFFLTALRRLGRPGARAMVRRHRGEIWLAGMPDGAAAVGAAGEPADPGARRRQLHPHVPPAAGQRPAGKRPGRRRSARRRLVHAVKDVDVAHADAANRPAPGRSPARPPPPPRWSGSPAASAGNAPARRHGCRARPCPRRPGCAGRSAAPRTWSGTRARHKAPRLPSAVHACSSSIRQPLKSFGCRNSTGLPWAPVFGSPSPSTRAPLAFSRSRAARMSSTS